MSSLIERHNEIKSHVRDLTLDLLSEKYNLDVNPKLRFNSKFRLFMPSRNLIKYVSNIGGVLTGSRALRCFLSNENLIFDRKTKDWDFIVTTEMAFKISNQFNIKYDLVDKVISVKNQRAWRHPAYSDSYRIGPVDVQLIIKDELPDFIKTPEIRISKLNYIINEKNKIIEDMLSNYGLSWNVYGTQKDAPTISPMPVVKAYYFRPVNVSGVPTVIDNSEKDLEKHIDDLTNLIIKFNAQKHLV